MSQLMRTALTLGLCTLTLSACFHEQTQPSAQRDDGSIAFTPLNDTGVTQFLDDYTFPTRAAGVTAPLPVLVPTEPSTLPGQDASYGADLTQPYDGNGSKGFNFIKLDSQGIALPNQSVTYDPALAPWSCVLDGVTGLMWEVKTPGGLQSRNSRYTWYDPDPASNGGNTGSSGSTTSCNFLSSCNTYEYVNAVNALNNGAGLCGYTDWRLPTREELRSLINYGTPKSAGVAVVDSNFFPNAISSDHWSSQTALYRADSGQSAFEVHFDDGHSEGHLKSATDVYVRLVRHTH